MARAARPARKSGARKDKWLVTGGQWLVVGCRFLVTECWSPATRHRPPTTTADAFASGEKREERVIERLGRVEERIVDAALTKHAAQARDVSGDELTILPAQVVGNHRHAFAGLEVEEVRRVGEGKLELAPVEDVEDDQIVPLPSQMGQRLQHVGWLLVQVGNHQHDRATAKRLAETSRDRAQGLGTADCGLRTADAGVPRFLVRSPESVGRSWSSVCSTT